MELNIANVNNVHRLISRQSFPYQRLCFVNVTRNDVYIRSPYRKIHPVSCRACTFGAEWQVHIIIMALTLNVIYEEIGNKITNIISSNVQCTKQVYNSSTIIHRENRNERIFLGMKESSVSHLPVQWVTIGRPPQNRRRCVSSCRIFYTHTRTHCHPVHSNYDNVAWVTITGKRDGKINNKYSRYIQGHVNLRQSQPMQK